MTVCLLKKKSKNRVVCVIQARMGSSRLPAKVLEKIEKKTMLELVVERVLRSQLIDKVVVATSTEKRDDAVADLVRKRWPSRVGLFRGSEKDVLSRYYLAAKVFKAENIVRITSDCPLIDPRIVDLVIKKHLISKADYTSNDLKKTFPWGLDVQVFNFKTLRKAWREAKKPFEREHVIPYIYEHPEYFKLENLEAKGKLRRPELRLVVDEKEDLQLVREIYKYLHSPGKIFSAEQTIALLDKRPALKRINAHIKQRHFIKN